MNIQKILHEMTLEEKAGMCSGADLWHTKPVERLGVPSIMMSDGPHGLRTQMKHGKVYDTSIRAVCFPTGVALASSFDRELLKKVGRIIGEQALAAGVQVVLGPAINMKRSPLCGRNFEYLSEDPMVAGELAAAYVEGMQEVGVSACVKHFAANNQEDSRMSVSSEIDERTLREIYMAAFETVVKKSDPWSIMCSYNRINGTYACENRWLLTDILRKEWGFQGVVVTDWGAMNDRTKALRAGLNLEMPSSNGENDKRLAEAVRAGVLEESVLDEAVLEILEWNEKVTKRAHTQTGLASRLTQDHEAAREIALECAVLLKNEGSILPISKQAKVAFIGAFAENPRFQGGGSSYINCSEVTGAIQAAEKYPNVVYAKGFDADQDLVEDSLVSEAVATAVQADVAVIFAGLPDAYESEGFDREHLELPECQNRLIDAVTQVQPNTVVVLHNGSPVRMPWLDKVRGVLEMYLGGQAVGGATVDLLFGDANPCGKLAETFPMRIEDTPCYLDYPSTIANGAYSEGVFIGYRWYESRRMPVLFPFGFGLSYTTFALRNLQCSSLRLGDGDSLRVSACVENTGPRSGKEVVQLYIAPTKNGAVRRPAKELKAFEKVSLEPGEKKTITFTLDMRSFAYFEPRIGDWYSEPGTYSILVGTSSADLPLAAAIQVKTDRKLPFVISEITTCGDIIEHVGMTPEFERLLNRTSLLVRADESNENSAKDVLGKSSVRMSREMLYGLPLHSLVSFSDITHEEIQEFIASIQL